LVEISRASGEHSWRKKRNKLAAEEQANVVSVCEKPNQQQNDSMAA
jgi:hypothetical protein